MHKKNIHKMHKMHVNEKHVHKMHKMHVNEKHKIKQMRNETHKSVSEPPAKAWVVSVDMGYGHQRAAYPLKDIAYQRIITANNDKIISGKDHDLWEKSRKFYESISRLKHFPIVGPFIYGFYDQLQQISPFFPFRDLSKPNFSVLKTKNMIVKGFCESLVQYLSKENVPVITTHFIPALALNYAKKPVYCVVTDTDINRVWVPDNPKESTITYFSPCRHVTQRLKQYGVDENLIVETGFPLPKENIGNNQSILKHDLIARLVNLDPNGIFFDRYGELVKKKLGLNLKTKMDLKGVQRFKDHTLTLTFAIGGAGAQADIAEKIITSLKEKILHEELRLNIVVGTKLDLKMRFENQIEELGLHECMGKNINVIFAIDKKTYFELTNQALRTTDVLWTKPSELSFYTALGLPIIIAPPLGAHENFNKEWLSHIGSGFEQDNPDYVHDWLFYWINEGRLADAAFHGFIDAPIMGAYNIEEYVLNHSFGITPNPAKRENI